MASKNEREQDGTPIWHRVLPFFAALGMALVTYWALRGTWTGAPELAPYVGTSAEMMRMLIILTIPISPTTWIILGLLYLGVRMNADVIPHSS